MSSILTTDEYITQAADLEPGETITDDMAKTIASWWHGGRDHNITALSHGLEWSKSGITDEIDQNIRARAQDPAIVVEGDLPGGADLEALRQWVSEQMINSVWSSYDHTFIGSDDYEDCLTCGAQYELVHAAESQLSSGRYRTSNGDDPMNCSGDTSMVHGEGYCDCDCDDEDGCEHCRHDCNCIICRG